MLEELYKFNLSKDQEKLAKKIHSEGIIADMLFQGPVGTYSLGEGIEQELLEIAEKAHPNDPMKQANVAGKILHEWMIDGKLSDLYKECFDSSGINLTCRQLSIGSQDSLMRSIVSCQEEFDKKPFLVKCRSGEDIKKAHKEGKKACMVTSQATMGYGQDLSLLEMAHQFGLRIQQLSYNNHNHIGAGCMEPNDAGLSVFGRKFVAKCNELNILIDTGHCGKQTTLDACKFSNKPVVATHTAAEKIFMHNRCKSDEELKAIAETGGVIGVFAMPWFIHEDYNNTTVDHVIDHMEYIANLVGVDHVGIGTDWPMPQPKWLAISFKKYVAHTMGFAPGDGPSTEWIHGIKDYRSMINLTRGLLARGYSEQDTRKIMGENWFRVINEVCK